MKRFIALLLSVVMTFSVGISTFADSSGTSSGLVMNDIIMLSPDFVSEHPVDLEDSSQSYTSYYPYVVEVGEKVYYVKQEKFDALKAEYNEYLSANKKEASTLLIKQDLVFDKEGYDILKDVIEVKDSKGNQVDISNFIVYVNGKCVNWITDKTDFPAILTDVGLYDIELVGRYEYTGSNLRGSLEISPLRVGYYSGYDKLGDSYTFNMISAYQGVVNLQDCVMILQYKKDGKWVSVYRDKVGFNGEVAQLKISVEDMVRYGFRLGNEGRVYVSDINGYNHNVLGSPEETEIPFLFDADVTSFDYAELIKEDNGDIEQKERNKDSIRSIRDLIIQYGSVDTTADVKAWVLKVRDWNNKNDDNLFYSTIDSTITDMLTDEAYSSNNLDNIVNRLKYLSLMEDDIYLSDLVDLGHYVYESGDSGDKYVLGRLVYDWNNENYNNPMYTEIVSTLGEFISGEADDFNIDALLGSLQYIESIGYIEQGKEEIIVPENDEVLDELIEKAKGLESNADIGQWILQVIDWNDTNTDVTTHNIIERLTLKEMSKSRHVSDNIESVLGYISDKGKGRVMTLKELIEYCKKSGTNSTVLSLYARDWNELNSSNPIYERLKTALTKSLSGTSNNKDMVISLLQYVDDSDYEEIINDIEESTSEITTGTESTSESTSESTTEESTSEGTSESTSESLTESTSESTTEATTERTTKETTTKETTTREKSSSRYNYWWRRSSSSRSSGGSSSDKADVNRQQQTIKTANGTKTISSEVTKEIKDSVNSFNNLKLDRCSITVNKTLGYAKIHLTDGSSASAIKHKSYKRAYVILGIDSDDDMQKSYWDYSRESEEEIDFDGQYKYYELYPVDVYNIISMKIGDQSTRSNYETVTLDVAPEIMEDKTMVPVRYIAEQLGATVEWDDESKTATIKKDGSKTLTLDTVSGTSGCVIKDGRTLVPLRYVSERLNSDVYWNSKEKGIVIVNLRDEIKNK